MIPLMQWDARRKIADQIVQQKGDYVLSLKENHGLLHEDVTTYFKSPLSPEVAIQTIDGGHGRIETRTLRVSEKLDWLEKEHSWTGPKSILAVTAKREISEKVTEETRYFSSSLSADDPGKLEHAVRAYWSIENNEHWILDVAFDEDSNRTCKGYKRCQSCHNSIYYFKTVLLKNEWVNYNLLNLKAIKIILS